MSMHPVQSAAILNALFKTGGSAGATPEQEAATLLSKGIDVNGDYGPLMYFVAFKNDGNKKDGENAQRLDGYKAIINSTSWYYTVNVASEPFEYTDNKGYELSVTLSGWKIMKYPNQRVYYPENAYLALYTTMPDKNGNGYVEPINAADGSNTTYMRIDLHKAIITGGVSISRATAGEEAYTNVTVNTELMAYPEVSGVTWGTIIGFGIHNTEVPGTGTPTAWARLNTPMATTIGRVPLFRKGKFNISFGPMGETEGCAILDGLLGFKYGNLISFSSQIWLGLLTRAPKSDRTAYEDGRYFSEPDDPEYVRVRLDDVSRINGKWFISGTEYGEPVVVNDAGDLGQPNVVKNQSLILMNEITQPTTIVAWGLFRSNDTTKDTLPFLTGTVMDSSGASTIEFKAEDIPIVREGGLQISMM